MADQSMTNVIAAIKRETTFGVAAASGAGAYALPLIDSEGLGLEYTRIVSGRHQRNAIANMGRLGSKSAAGTYAMEVLPGGAIDLLLESISRAGWSAALAPAAISITNTSTVITRAAGSFLTDGYKAGDIITFTGDTTTANNNLRLRVDTVTALNMTLAGTAPLTAQAVARSVTITRLKKVMPGATPTYHSYTIEQYEGDVDQGELFLGERLVGATLSQRPNAPVTLNASFQGVDRQIIDTAAAPYFTSPTELTGDSLIADDGWIRYKGSDVAKISGFDISFAIDNAIIPFIGTRVPNDVYMGDLTPTATITAARSSLAALQDYDAETEFAVSSLLLQPGADPRGAIGIHFPRVKIGRVTASFLGGAGVKIETRELMIGTHAGDTDNDTTPFIFFSSAP